jgi:hypothetical protein
LAPKQAEEANNLADKAIMRKFAFGLWRHVGNAVLVASFGIILAVQAYAAESTRRFENTNEQFAITLTTDWKEMSSDEVVKESTGTAFGGGSTCYGYKLAPQGALANAQAYIFVEVEKDERVPQPYIARFQHDVMRRRAALERLASQGIAEKDFLDSSFDVARLLLRVSASKTLENGVRVRFLQGVFFTEKGAMTVTCSAPAENYRGLAQTFTTAVDRFQIDPSLKYMPRKGEVAAGTPAQRAVRVRFSFGFIFVIVAIGLAITRFFAKRVSSDEV